MDIMVYQELKAVMRCLPDLKLDDDDESGPIPVKLVIDQEESKNEFVMSLVWGAWHPPRIVWLVPRAGQRVNHHRIEMNRDTPSWKGFYKKGGVCMSNNRSKVEDLKEVHSSPSLQQGSRENYLKLLDICSKHPKQRFQIKEDNKQLMNILKKL
ncbi:hypothetical protein RF11_09769 [Thelohanellus kitauei]|uniref:Uncharacterized protein n=1 Tax=Thelohanellus kitauei TaxID=669202 RepID=A0A0C2MZ88_THEKT|nr:hypothetical protein RF11_09769 [Thelohanellus kitauei]